MWDHYQKKAGLPPTFVLAPVRYVVHDGGVIVRREPPNQTGWLEAYRITSPTTMTSADIIKADGTVYNLSDHLPPPDVSTVTLAKPGADTGVYAKCGPEADAVLAKVAEDTAGSKTEMDRVVADARQTILSNPLAKTFADLAWERDIQERCKYLNEDDNMKMMLVNIGTNKKWASELSYDFFLGLSKLASDEAKNADCSSGQTQSTFESLWRVIQKVSDR